MCFNMKTTNGKSHSAGSVYFYIVLWAELAWRSCSEMDCHATARGSIPGGNGVKKQNFKSFAGDSKWGCCL